MIKDRREYKREYNKQWYQDNKESELEKSRKWHQENREASNVSKRKYKQFLRDLINDQKKLGACVRCGITDYRVLDFHHIDPSKKRFEVNTALKKNIGDQSILDEIAKCELVCSNCHRILHWEERYEGEVSAQKKCRPISSSRRPLLCAEKGASHL